MLNRPTPPGIGSIAGSIAPSGASRACGCAGIRTVVRRGANRCAADREDERPFEDHHDGSDGEVCSVSSPVEREEREVAAWGFRQDALRDPLLGGRDEGLR